MLHRNSSKKNKIIQKLRLTYTEIQVKQIMSQDSLFMDNKDREFILETIKAYAKFGNPIVVLHGTDTLDQTAKYCFDNFKDI